MEAEESNKLVKTGRWVLVCLWSASALIIGAMVVFWINADATQLFENKTEISVDELLLKSNNIAEDATLVNMNLNVTRKYLAAPVQNVLGGTKTEQRKKIYKKILADKIEKASKVHTSEDFLIKPVPK